MAIKMAFKMAFDAGRFKGKKMFNNYDGEIFEFKNASYFTQFDNDYDSNEDPDFENLDLDADDDTDGEYDLDEGAHENTRVCFRGEGLALGPCGHICCEVVRCAVKLSGRPFNSFLKYHGESSHNACTDKECNHPNAFEILAKAKHISLATRGRGKALRPLNKNPGKRQALRKFLNDRRWMSKRIKLQGRAIDKSKDSSSSDDKVRTQFKKVREL